MSIRVFLNPQDIIEVIYNGDLTVHDQIAAQNTIYRLSYELEKMRKPTRILIDNTHLRLPKSLEANALLERLFARSIADLQFEKIAGFGATIDIKKKAGDIMEDAKKPQPSFMQQFASRSEALEWLLEKKPVKQPARASLRK